MRSRSLSVDSWDDYFHPFEFEILKKILQGKNRRTKIEYTEDPKAREDFEVVMKDLAFLAKAGLLGFNSMRPGATLSRPVSAFLDNCELPAYDVDHGPTQRGNTASPRPSYRPQHKSLLPARCAQLPLQ